LACLFKNKDFRFNIKAYSRDFNVDRSSIYQVLKRLISKGLVIKNNTGSFCITKKGVTICQSSNIKSFSGKGSVCKSRRECVSDSDLSVHYLRFVLNISDRKGFFERNLDGLVWKRVDLPNLVQYYVYFDDATVIVSPKRLIIRVKDLVGTETEDLLLEGLNLALRYVRMFEDFGVKGEGLFLDNVHFARIKSVLADFLKSVDDRFFVDFGDGKKFWIDFSGGKVEDETNSLEIRDRIDAFLRDVVDSESLMSDVDKMKEVLGLLVKLRVLDLEVSRGMYKGDVNGDKPDYFG